MPAVVGLSMPRWQPSMEYHECGVVASVTIESIPVRMGSSGSDRGKTVNLELMPPST